jgi:hypothetical protein
MELHKNIVFDENQQPIAVQIPIAEFQRLEEVLENYGLSKLMDEVSEDEHLSIQEAKAFYRSLKIDLESYKKIFTDFSLINHCLQKRGRC